MTPRLVFVLFFLILATVDVAKADASELKIPAGDKQLECLQYNCGFLCDFCMLFKAKNVPENYKECLDEVIYDHCKSLARPYRSKANIDH